MYMCMCECFCSCSTTGTTKCQPMPATGSYWQSSTWQGPQDNSFLKNPADEKYICEVLSKNIRDVVAEVPSISVSSFNELECYLLRVVKRVSTLEFSKLGMSHNVPSSGPKIISTASVVLN